MLRTALVSWKKDNPALSPLWSAFLKYKISSASWAAMVLLSSSYLKILSTVACCNQPQGTGNLTAVMPHRCSWSKCHLKTRPMKRDKISAYFRPGPGPRFFKPINALTAFIDPVASRMTWCNCIVSLATAFTRLSMLCFSCSPSAMYSRRLSRKKAHHNGQEYHQAFGAHIL